MAEKKITDLSGCQCKPRAHRRQIKQFPVGAQVVAISEIGNALGELPLPVGSTGQVSYHCDDGRASIQFDADGSCHTFHFPEQHIMVERRTAKVQAIQRENEDLRNLVARLCSNLAEHIIITRRAAEQLSNNVRPMKRAEQAIKDARELLKQ